MTSSTTHAGYKPGTYQHLQHLLAGLTLDEQREVSEVIGSEEDWDVFLEEYKADLAHARGEGISRS